MRTAPIAASVALLFAMTSSGIAADLVRPAQRQVAVQPQATEVACLRWVEQTYSWYNYCDSIPYYGRQKQNLLGGY